VPCVPTGSGSGRLGRVRAPAGMKAVAELVEQQEYAAAIELIEHAEIADDADGSTLALLFALYLVEWRVDDAHFLFLRLGPHKLETTPELKPLKSIQEAMASQRAPANAIAGLVFPKKLQPIVDVLQGRLRAKQAELLRKSYSVVTVDHFAQALGKPTDDAIETAIALGWAFDKATHSLTRLTTAGVGGDVHEGVSKLSLQHLSSTIQKLEAK